MNTHFTEVLDYKNYCLVKQSQEYNGHDSGKIAKWAKRMDLQMKSAVLKPSYFISILSFFQNFKTACDSIGINEEVAMWVFQYFKKYPTRATLVVYFLHHGK